jgi:hypothetical protein
VYTSTLDTDVEVLGRDLLIGFSVADISVRANGGRDPSRVVNARLGEVAGYPSGTV